MSTIHTIRAHAQGVWDKSEKRLRVAVSQEKVVTHDSNSDLPLTLIYYYSD